MEKSALTKIVSKFQVTVPKEIRDAFGLQEGDLLEWSLQGQDKKYTINIIPKRAQLITPRLEALVDSVKRKRQQTREENAVVARARGASSV
jgi:AbrB family looped-hinge helix DNA binding protein